MSRFLPTTLTTSPHLKSKVDVPTIMKNVVWALQPIVFMAFFAFGWSALLVIFTTTISCFATERLYNSLLKKEQTTSDYSAIITGILLGLTLPPGFPLWMAILGSVFAILVGKLIFGGIGFNPFNPALVGRAFLQTAFPGSITTWVTVFSPDRFDKVLSTTFTMPFMKPVLASVDAISSATPLAAFKFEQHQSNTFDLFSGAIAGSAGETSAIVILLCGLYLALRKMLDWRIPVGILASAAIFSTILHIINPAFPSAFFTLLSGGLMLGAVFMATDMVTSPMSAKAVWIYGVFIGIVVVVIRVWGGLPEGVMYAILLANAIVPLLNLMKSGRVYGTKTSSKQVQS